ncbi:MAG: hypothetical protein ACOYI4_09455, partial [Christensenellales bacterium]
MRKCKTLKMVCCGVAVLFMLGGCGAKAPQQTPFVMFSPMTSVWTSLAPVIPSVPPPDSPAGTMPEELNAAMLIATLEMLDGVDGALVVELDGTYIAGVALEDGADAEAVVDAATSALLAKLPEGAEVVVTTDGSMLE